MKSIKVTDEMYDRLMDLSNEIRTQDNRATAKPYFFQVRQDKKLWDSSDSRGNICYFDRDSQTEYDATPEGVKEMCENFSLEFPENIESMDCWNIEDWLDENNIELQRCSYDIGHEYQNAFFTEKACKEHIERNHYHYSNPVDFLQHAFRNPELELIFEFLTEMQDQRTLKEP